MSLRQLIRPLLLHLLERKPRSHRLYTLYMRLYRPRGDEHSRLLQRHLGVHSIGTNTYVNYGTAIIDPPYVRIGNNVVLSDCTIFGHDGAAQVLAKAYGVPLDAVGKVDIKDNVFVGWGAIIMPGVTIGPNAVVGAGSVVTKDVAPGTVVGGVPARQIGTVDELVQKMQARTRELPWADLIMQRGPTTLDPRFEEKLVAARIRFFWGDPSHPAS
jgi:acetyltransferase-like isoleucine patch superfamily enzyme